MSAHNDERWMRAALTLGRRHQGQTWPNPAVGALVVRDGVVMGRGATARGGRPHAEPQALAQAGEGARGATMYVTLEPCSHHGKTPPCVDAIIQAGIARVVVACLDPDRRVAGRGIRRLQDAGCEVDVGVLQAQAWQDHAGHIRRIMDHRPHVTLKLALSADGQMGCKGERIQITGPEAARYTHHLRAGQDAILVGITTALTDDPLLTCRWPGLEACSPVRIILDTHLRLPLTHQLVATARQTPLWMICGEGASADKEQELTARGVRIIRTKTPHDLNRVMQRLAQEGITRLLVEGGAGLAQNCLERDLVDELITLTGPQSLETQTLPAPEALASVKAGMKPIDSRMLGMDHLDHVIRRQS